MAQPIYKFFLAGFSEAWYQFSEASKKVSKPSLKASECGCGLLRNSDARRIECQGKTRTAFSAATVGMGG